MDIGHRLRSLREQKNLSQGDMEKRTGLLRCYISRVENGHTVPAVETLEKLARAMEMPLYQLLYDGEEPPVSAPRSNGNQPAQWGSSGKNSRFVSRLCRSLAKMSETDRQVLLSFAENLSKRKRPSASSE
jgi:transcriptional regulator with XRE-family HTH domain